jgi:hypothetical protein
MRTRAIAAAVLIAFAPAAAGAPAFAQPAADDPTTKQARARFQEGVDQYDKGNFESARASFLQAYALKKHPAVLLNLGLSCLKSNHPLEALSYLKQFLRESTTATPAQKTEAENGIRDARNRLGQIEVVAPNGTEISVENDRIGNTPLAEPVDAEPGPKAVRAKLPDGTTDTQRVTVTAGQRVQAKFGASSAPAVVAPVPVPTSPATTPATEPVQAAPQPQDPNANANATITSDTGRKKGFRPPETMTPVWIGLGVAVVGAGVAVGFALAKNSAQENADAIALEIRAKNGGSSKSLTTGQPICSSTSKADQDKFGRACLALKDNNDKVDADATIANIAIVVGALGAATALGWFLFAPRKKDEAPAQATWKVPEIRPVYAPGYGGLSLSGTF